MNKNENINNNINDNNQPELRFANQKSTTDYIYLDNAASASEAEFCVPDTFANPNSVHDAGRDGFKALEEARESILNAIGAARPTEIIFTSGATEANNAILFGVSRAVAKERGLIDKYGICDRDNLPKIVTCAIEHDSILVPLKHIEQRGFEVEILPVNDAGFVSLEDLDNAVDKRTVLVAIQTANTEIGTVQDIAPMAEIAHKVGAYFHTDAVGAFGKIPFDVRELGVDSASFSGHKIGAPKGIGAIYLKSGTPFTPLFYGSGQEGDRRSGTQNTAGAAAMGKAIKRSMADIYSLSDRMAKLRNYLYEQMGSIHGVRLTVPTAYKNIRFLPNICHVLFEGHTSEEVVIYLNKLGIQVSGGPACSSEESEPSHVLTAIGIPREDAFGAIRISFGFHTTRKELDELISAVIKFCAENN